LHTGNVILALVQSSDHVPFRSSLLTRLMQDCLGGTAATMLICNLSPSHNSVIETLSSLRFADRVKHVKNESNVVQRVPPKDGRSGSQEQRELHAQVVALQRALLESQRENQHLKIQLTNARTARSSTNQEGKLNAWCPHCNEPWAPLDEINV
jgi:hypothetical protein